MPLAFRGVHQAILDDTTLERDVEGALSSGKTIACMWDEIDALIAEPGIWILIGRWTGDATDTLLRPQFEQLCRLHDFATWTWDDKKKFYEWPNGSRAYAFGLKTQSQDPEERFGKIRGLPVSRIYISQAEQIPEDIASELSSRMRPDIEAQARGDAYRRQLTYDANSVDDDTGPSGHWLAKKFPINNSIKGRKYFKLSLRDNAHNLPADFIEQQERNWPPEHPKHKTMILGERGFAVSGAPIYESLFDRATHVREMPATSDTALLEGFAVGKHNPTWIAATRTSSGALLLLGGLIGQGLMLEDFLPLVKQYRADWFPYLQPSMLKSCIAPMGESKASDTVRMTLLQTIKRAGFLLQTRENANAPDVQLAMIEYIGGLLRRRTATRQECIGVNSDPMRWLTVSHEGVKPLPFVAYSFEGGYVWNKHKISISHQEVRQPYEDDKYANAMHCIENIVLNFCTSAKTDDERDEEKRKALERAAITNNQASESGPSHAWMRS